jgi:uncharacterized protein YkwD
MNIPKITKIVAILALASALAACGGGGSDSSTAPAANVPVTQPSNPVSPANENSTLVTQIPATTYAAGSEEKLAFELWNRERSHCGFGLLTQNTLLDRSAAAHTAWGNKNKAVGHGEEPATPGFTGATPFDRMVAAGYPTTFDGNASEVGSLIRNEHLAGFGVASIHGLLSAPYHGIAMLGSLRDAGLSVQSYAASPTDTVLTGFYANMSTPGGAVPVNGTGKQYIAGGDVATYPCEGTADTRFELRNESPEPVPGRDLSTNPLGHPVYVMLRDGHKLTITKAAMTENATGVSIALRAPVTGENDIYGGCLLGCFLTNQGYVIPDAPLKANTKYHVTISGGNNGVAFTRDFTFATGSPGI